MEYFNNIHHEKKERIHTHSELLQKKFITQNLYQIDVYYHRHQLKQLPRFPFNFK
jgi:hypothetical protein